MKMKPILIELINVKEHSKTSNRLDEKELQSYIPLIQQHLVNGGDLRIQVGDQYQLSAVTQVRNKPGITVPIKIRLTTMRGTSTESATDAIIDGIQRMILSMLLENGIPHMMVQL